LETSPTFLLDISGRKVMESYLGPNDVSRLGAGLTSCGQRIAVGGQGCDSEIGDDNEENLCVVVGGGGATALLRLTGGIATPVRVHQRADIKDQTAESDAVDLSRNPGSGTWFGL
jgi:hypothetical protein